MKWKLETDPAVVDGWCLRVRTMGREFYLWTRPWWRPRLTVLPDVEDVS
jgi:hypothetical protein